MENKIPPYLLGGQEADSFPDRKIRFSFLDRTIFSSAGAVKTIYLQAETSANKGLIQNINPFVKLLSLIYLVVIVSLSVNIISQAVAAGFIFFIFLLSKLRMADIYRKAFIIAVIFGFVIALPASLNIVTPGRLVFPFISLSHPSSFWIYSIPQEIYFTDQGIRLVSLLFLRIFNSVSVALLVIYTTPFPRFVKSLKQLGVPDTFLMIISLAYKYIFILSRTIEDTYLALRSRLSGNLKKSRIRELAGGRIFFIYKRSQLIYEGTYYAMVSRGYNGNLKLLAQNKLNSCDIIALAVVLAMGIIIILL